MTPKQSPRTINGYRRRIRSIRAPWKKDCRPYSLLSQMLREGTIHDIDRQIGAINQSARGSGEDARDAARLVDDFRKQKLMA